MGSCQVDLSDPDVLTDPYPLYRALREAGPVHWTVTPDGGRAWLVTRHDDAQRLLRDSKLVKDRRTASAASSGSSPKRRGGRGSIFRHMLDTDPPEHSRLRGCVHRAFTQKVVNALFPRIESFARGLIGRFEVSRTVDLVDEYAAPIAVTVIAELLGVPGGDQARFRTWAENMTPAGPFGPDQVQQAFMDFSAYFQELVEIRRRSPADDLLSELLTAAGDSEQLTSEELYSMILFLLIAGHETSLNSIANGILALLGHPEQLELLRNCPQLLPTAVEELLRFDGPVRVTTSRYLTEPYVLGDVEMKPRDQVLVLLGSVNRDPAAFDDPESLNISRSSNRHLAFGLGPHFCLGAQLARAESAIAIASLLQAGEFKLAVEPAQIHWRPSLFIRGIKHLPVRFSLYRPVRA